MRTLALVGATLSLVSLLVSPGFAQQVSSLTAAERAGIALARLGARQRVRLCRNAREYAACNWLVDAAANGELCRSCALSEVIPDLADLHGFAPFSLGYFARSTSNSLDA